MMTKKALKKLQKSLAAPPREIQTFDLLPSETILEDDHPIHSFYVYIVDGVLTRQVEYFDITVADWKRRDGIKEVRRCNLFGHPGARLGDKVELNEKD